MSLLLTNEQTQCIEEIIQLITNRLINKQESEQMVGLYNGLAGHLLFLFQLSKYNSEWVDEKAFNAKLEYIQDALPYLTEQVDLCNGLTGVAWLLEYFNQCQGEDYEAQMCEAVDDMLVEYVNAKPWDGEIEFIYGLAGVACYAARRGRFGQGLELYEFIVDFYDKQAIKCEVGISWSQPLSSNFRYDKKSEHEFNLGLAHGMPGILSVLLPACSMPLMGERAIRLVTQGCDWLVAQGEKLDGNVSFYGTKAGDRRSSRLGWCYGDATIALTLMRVGNVLQRQDYVDFATKVALDCAERDVKQAMIYDAGLCHGSAGLALIFKLLYQQAQQPELLKASEFWLDYTLNLYRKDGLKGLDMYDGPSKTYKSSDTLLMGNAGVGLCLLGLLDDGQLNAKGWLDCMSLI